MAGEGGGGRGSEGREENSAAEGRREDNTFLACATAQRLPLGGGDHTRWEGKRNIGFRWNRRGRSFKTGSVRQRGWGDKKRKGS